MRSDIAYIAKHFLHKTFFLFPADDDAFPLDMTAVAFDAVHPAHIYNISLMDPVKTVAFQCFSSGPSLATALFNLWESIK